jgi:prepilin-type N-terminal cleavage/methylation domain-containing protein
MKLKAFSLIEIVVALFLSAIVISAVYSGYVFTHQQFFKFASIKTEISNYYKLSEVLHREFEMSQRVLKTGERRIAIEQMNQTINYHFDQDFIVRAIKEQTDTFFFKVEGLEIIGFNIKNEVVLEHLRINLNEERTLSFTKTYGAILQIEKEDGNSY